MILKKFAFHREVPEPALCVFFLLLKSSLGLPSGRQAKSTMDRHFMALIVVCLMMLAFTATLAVPVGVNWGRMVAQRILPSMVVDILMDNRIPYVKMYSINAKVLEAFSNSGIEIMLAIPNNYLNYYVDDHNCSALINAEIKQYHESANIRYLAIGNEPFSPHIPQADFNRKYALPAMQCIQKALNTYGYKGKINLTIPHNIDVLTTALHPSKAEFVPDIKELMIKTLSFQRENGGFFLVNINTVQMLQNYGLDLEFALFDRRSNYTIRDNNVTYTNLFDVIYDSYVSALTKAGFGDMEIVVGQIGWPTDGFPYTSVAYAKRFYAGLLPKLKKNVGTPLRPRQPIKAYLYSLADENRNPIGQNNYYQRHWGIYKYDGKPKFEIDFSGKGKSTWPVSAKGISYLPERWCVFNGDWSDRSKVYAEFEFACNNSDCTSLMYGGSCNHLNEDSNISYAFNMLFQITSQLASDEACVFGGLGIVVTRNASVGSCNFPIQILASPDEKFRIFLGAASMNPVPFMNLALLFIFLALYGFMVVC